MAAFNTGSFELFFESLYGYGPFPWQSMLLERVLDPNHGWPDLIDLPTASGKTACIDVSIFALAAGVRTPRRTWFVVDRRIVVDEAYERARKIAVALRYAVADARERKRMDQDNELGPIVRSLADTGATVLADVAVALLALGGSQRTPLEVGRLRGGAPRAVAWAGNPAQPTVLTSTIDQLGSRLLFRGYGVGAHAQPIQAALAGNDSLIVLDEAHLAGPFLQTVAAVQRFRGEPWSDEPVPQPFKLVVMSATPPDGMAAAARFPSDAGRAAALDHPMLRKRMSAPKPTTLAVASKPKAPKGKADTGGDELVLDAAARAVSFVAAGRQRVGVMVNRVATARLIHSRLLSSGVDAEVKLLTGRLRPPDRDALLVGLTPVLRSGSTVVLERPIILVTTQCLEVGADFSFDALICECASLDALRQRFGRLARLGDPADAEGVILTRKADTRPDEKLDEDKPLDPIYANAAARTWNWLTGNGATTIEMGIDTLAPRIEALERAGGMRDQLGPRLDAPVLLPAHLDLWSQTTLPRPCFQPDIPLFLHGVPPPDHRPRVDVRVLWRDDLTLVDASRWKELTVNLPPLPGEMAQVPLWEFGEAIADTTSAGGSDADLEGVHEPAPQANRRTQDATVVTPFVRWRGADDCVVLTDLRDVRADDVLILPADSAAFMTLLPGAVLKPDVYEQAYRAKYDNIRKLERTFRAKGQAPGEIEEDEVVERLTADLDEAERRFFIQPRAVQYEAGFYHVTGKPKVVPLDLWESDDDEDAALYTGNALTLADHTRQVRAAADTLLDRLGARERFGGTLGRAADLHDAGKADPRFQYLLLHGRRTAGELVAKSKVRLSRSQEARLYELSELPAGFRHELLSMQMATLQPSAGADDGARDLLLHLIGAHHGQCRPFARVIIDGAPPAVSVASPDGTLSISPDQRYEVPPHRLDSGVAERFWRLTRRYGWWGLAYLETILRCADIHASAFAEQEGRR